MLFLPLGGKTSPWGEGRSAVALPLVWWSLLDGVCPVALAKRQITMSKHDQSNMAVEASPEASLIMVEPKFSFGVLIESLDNPADVRKFNQFFQAERVQLPGKVIFEILPFEPTWRRDAHSRASPEQASERLDSRFEILQPWQTLL